MPDLQEYSDERVFMNTQIKMTLVTSRGTVAARSDLGNAFSAFDQVVKRFTRFEPTSELSRLNASRQPFKASPELITRMLQVADLTDGAYDPTIIDLLELYGFSEKQDYERMDNPALLQEIRQYVARRPSFREIALDPDQQLVTTAHRQRLDLGSIGKGFAIDLAALALKSHQGYLINAGGDLRAGGTRKDGADWKLGVVQLSLPNKQLTDPQVIGTVSSPIALAGSGGWVRRVAWFHHLLNPRDGLPQNNVSQSFVTASTATDADLWATALFVTGKEGLALLKAQNGIEGMLIMSDGTRHFSEGFSLQ